MLACIKNIKIEKEKEKEKSTRTKNCKYKRKTNGNVKKHIEEKKREKHVEPLQNRSKTHGRIHESVAKPPHICVNWADTSYRSPSTRQNCDWQ